MKTDQWKKKRSTTIQFDGLCYDPCGNVCDILPDHRKSIPSRFISGTKFIYTTLSTAVRRENFTKNDNTLSWETSLAGEILLQSLYVQNDIVYIYFISYSFDLFIISELHKSIWDFNKNSSSHTIENLTRSDSLLQTNG